MAAVISVERQPMPTRRLDKEHLKTHTGACCRVSLAEALTWRSTRLLTRGFSFFDEHACGGLRLASFGCSPPRLR